MILVHVLKRHQWHHEYLKLLISGAEMRGAADATVINYCQKPFLARVEVEFTGIPGLGSNANKTPASSMWFCLLCKSLPMSLINMCCWGVAASASEDFCGLDNLGSACSSLMDPMVHAVALSQFSLFRKIIPKPVCHVLSVSVWPFHLDF